MAQQKRGLGKGLGALIPTGPVTPAGGMARGGMPGGSGLAPGGVAGRAARPAP